MKGEGAGRERPSRSRFGAGSLTSRYLGLAVLDLEEVLAAGHVGTAARFLHGVQYELDFRVPRERLVDIALRPRPRLLVDLGVPAPAPALPGTCARTAVFRHRRRSAALSA